MDSAGFEILPAPSELRPFVRRYMYANRALPEPLLLRPKPTGYCYFSNSFGGSPRDTIVVDGEACARPSRWYLAGQIVDQDIEIHLHECLSVIYTELTVTAPFRLFGLRGRAFAGTALPLEAVGPRIVALARDCFASSPDAPPGRHVEEASRFFSHLADSAGPDDPVVAGAVALFEKENGAMRVADIAREIGVSARTLNRRFGEVIGISPKTFGQILQINWVVGSLYSQDKVRLAAIAQAAGFSDQAHLHRAMQRFFNEGPRAFLASEHIAFATFLGGSRDVDATAKPG